MVLAVAMIASSSSAAAAAVLSISEADRQWRVARITRSNSTSAIFPEEPECVHAVTSPRIAGRAGHGPRAQVRPGGGHDGRAADRDRHARRDRAHGHEPAPDPLDPGDPGRGRRRARRRHQGDPRAAPPRAQSRKARGAGRRRTGWIASRSTSMPRSRIPTTRSSSMPPRPGCAPGCCSGRSPRASTSTAKSRSPRISTTRSRSGVRPRPRASGTASSRTSCGCRAS